MDEETKKTSFTIEDDDKDEDGSEKSGIEGDICSAADSKEVKSTAVVKFSAVQSPVLFFKLRSNTDLNRPPENWLRESDRCQVLKGHTAPPSTKNNSQMFPSLQMASEFPDCVGEVDVVSNSEIIKKLLKMPYSNSQVSMMVHRVGKTLFLDEFDINMYLLRAAKKEWEWLRKFYVDNVLQSLNLQQKQKNFFRKNRSRDYLQHKNMLSKFLYHSVADVAASSPIGQNKSNGDQRAAGGASRSYVHGNKLSAQNLVDDFEEDQELEEDVDHNFQRNVLWTFEDIRMLIGTDMPIFGAGTHPCVSLRLRDITKPINILTGLDYWLDNLMCNVPEVMMCYHLDGIVQKYELIKTEDLPQLENSNFSPKVIKDIAQNVLSFLKSKATKAGHTYWLFKAKDNEVVKLYDLTTLCSSAVDEVEEEQNPFTMPLAMLLYRLASKMKALGPKKSQLGTILMLLQNCLALLDSKKHPQIAMSTHYHLSDLYLPDTVDLSSPNLSPGTTDDEDDDYDDEEVNEEENVETVVEENSFSSTSSSVEIKTLCLPNMLDNRACMSDNNASRYPLLPASLEERCQAAIHHAQDGLACLELDSDVKGDDDVNVGVREARTSTSSLATSPSSKTSHYQASTSTEEVQARAQPFKPIPLHYEPIHKSTKDPVQSVPEKMCLTSTRKFGEWTIRKARRLLQKGALATYVFAYRLYGSNKAGVALRYAELALRCYDAMERLGSTYSDTHAQPNILASHILLLAGDLHFLIIQNASHMTEYQQEYNNFSEFEGLFDRTRELNGEFRYEWAVSFHTKLEDNLRCSVSCYEGALERACDVLDRVKLRKRLGNIKNELGVFYLNQAHNMYMETGELSTEVENLWKISFECLQSGIQFFEGMDDDVNAALLNSNLGRLMRTRAHCYTPPKDSPKEFSTQEANYYEKAITYYRKSLRILGDFQEYANIRESVSWELSTTYFTMATLLQDFAPLSTKPQEEIEKEIAELMQKALKCIDLEKPTVRQPIYQYRAATIYHRLGSLYHHSYRHSISDESRKKQQRTLADIYFGKALGLFQILEDVGKSLEVHLERIGMWEFHIKNVTGAAAKVQSLYKLLEFMFEMVPILTVLVEKLSNTSDSKVCAIDLNSSNSNADDITIYVDLLSLVQQRLQFSLLSLVKLNAGKTPSSKKGQQQTNKSQTLQIYKRMYNEALQLTVPTKDNINVQNLIKTISEIRELYSNISLKR